MEPQILAPGLVGRPAPVPSLLSLELSLSCPRLKGLHLPHNRNHYFHPTLPITPWPQHLELNPGLSRPPGDLTEISLPPAGSRICSTENNSHFPLKVPLVK